MSETRKIYNFMVIIILLTYNILYRFVILNYFRNEESIITSIFFIILFIVSLAMYGYTKSKLNHAKKRVVKIATLTVIIGIGLTYAFGAFSGFLKNGYSLAIINIIKNTFPPIFIIVFTEMFRYNFIRSNKDKFSMIVIITILLSILEIQISVSPTVKWGLQEIFIFVTTLIIPIIAKNMLLGYLTYEVGYQPCLIYRLILELYIYFVPYVPKMGDYIKSMFGLCLPMAVYMYSSREIDEEDYGEEKEFRQKNSKLAKIPAYIFVFVFVALVSRVFPVFAVGIGSGSMTGALNKYDAAVAYRVGENSIKENDIIVFQTQDKIIIHRVVEIEEINGAKHFRTKGDVSATRDSFDTTIDKVYGKVFLRVPYIAYPSVWLTEQMEKHK